MNEDEKLDLSALDPMEDGEHWQRFVAETLERVDAVLARRPEDPFAMIAGWARPVLLAAAAVTALLIPVELALEARDTRSEQVKRLVSLSTDLEQRPATPSAAEFLRALAASDSL